MSGFIGATGTEADVCRDIARRQALGVTKYGTTVRENPLKVRDWLQHQYEELLDAAVYCKRAMEEMDRAVPEIVQEAVLTGSETWQRLGDQRDLDPYKQYQTGFVPPVPEQFLDRRSGGRAVKVNGMVKG